MNHSSKSIPALWSFDRDPHSSAALPTNMSNPQTWILSMWTLEGHGFPNPPSSAGDPRLCLQDSVPLSCVGWSLQQGKVFLMFPLLISRGLVFSSRQQTLCGHQFPRELSVYLNVKYWSTFSWDFFSFFSIHGHAVLCVWCVNMLVYMSMHTCAKARGRC